MTDVTRKQKACQQTVKSQGKVEEVKSPLSTFLSVCVVTQAQLLLERLVP